MTALPESYWDRLPLGRGVALLAREPCGLAAFAKPAGVLSHPNTPGDQARSLLDAAYDREHECFVWRGEGGVAGKLWLLNRLDSATSGLILAAADEVLAVRIRTLFQQRKIKKVYNALVFGAPRQEREVWRDRLVVEKREGHLRASTGGHIPAEAHLRLLRSRAAAPALALIELEPKTGRSHQLRVQCAKRHLPIVGDATYGDFRANREFAKATGCKRLFLHSLHTEFEYDWQGRALRFSATAPLPEEFQRVF